MIAKSAQAPTGPIHGLPGSKFPKHTKTAKQMANAYLDHPDCFTIKIDGQDEKLRGLRIDRSDLETLFRDPDIEEVFLMFAIHMDDIGKPHSDQRLTGLIYGLSHTTKGDKTTAKFEYDRAYDFCDPCPPFCPTNINNFD